MNWKNYFTKTILNRGRSYYDRRAVTNFNYDGKLCTANVIGQDIYNVRISNPGTSDIEMECDCPHAMKGFTCKHMAAVMYMWENVQEERDALKAPPVFPPLNSLARPFYYIPDMVSDFRIIPTVADKARKYIEDSTIKLNDFQVLYDAFDYGHLSLRSPYAEASAVFRDSGGYKKITALFREKTIRHYECNVCGDHYYGYYEGYYGIEKKKPCAHVTALFMLADEYTRRFDPGDYTDYNAARFMRVFGHEKAMNADSDDADTNSTVVLEPRLVETITGLELNFRIGNGGKLFVVKNITALYDSVSEHKEIKIFARSQRVFISWSASASVCHVTDSHDYQFSVLLNCILPDDTIVKSYFAIIWHKGCHFNNSG